MSDPESGCPILSLKNIYRLLTKDDFPVSSPVVIAKANRKGQTLTGFWHEILGEMLQLGELGGKLWQVGEQRNRYLSDLLNRTNATAFYEDYFRQAASAVNAEFFLGVIRRFQRFLHVRNYDYNALFERIHGYIPPIHTSDATITTAIHSYLQSLLWLEGDFACDEPTKLFYAAYCLAALAFHAFFGPQMGNDAMGRLRREPAYQLFQLYQVHLHRAHGMAFPPPLALTNAQSALCSPMMPADHFTGREGELSQVVDHIIRGTRTLISGIGGIGKTELLRQALNVLLEKGIFTRIAYVDYAGGLQESFDSAFTGLHGSSPEMRLNECVQLLTPAPQERTLLLIDRLDRAPDEDAGLALLAALRCDIVITSRLSGLPGFRALCLQGVSAPAARAIFARRYALPIQAVEERLLETLLWDTFQHHPLLCELLGSMARAKRYTITKLAGWLDENGLKGAFVNEAGRVDVSSFLFKLFQPDQLKKERQLLLRAFSLLPQRTYSFDICCLLLKDSASDSDSFVDELEALSHTGWLYSNPAGYGMHPIIAEVFRGDGVDHHIYPGLFHLLGSSLSPCASPLPAQYIDIAAHASRHICLTTPDAFYFLLNTVHQLANYSRFASAKWLLSHARDAVGRPGLDVPSMLFDWYAVHAALLFLTEQVESSEETVRELARLCPYAQNAKYALSGLKWAMILAGLNAMGDALEVLGQSLESLPRDGVSQALYCDVMSHLQIWVYADYGSGIQWAKTGIECLGRLGLSSSILALQLFNALAFNAANLGLFDEAMEGISHAERLLKDLYGDHDSHSVLVIQSTKGLAMYFHGDYEEAVALQREVLGRLRGLLQEDSLELGNALVNLGNSLYRMKEHDSAVDCFREAIAMHQRMSPIDNLDRSTYLVSLGCALRDRGDRDEARKALEQAAFIAENIVGKDNVCYAQPHYHLGLLFDLQGELSLVRDHLLLSLPGFERTYGADHHRSRDIRERLKALSESA